MDLTEKTIKSESIFKGNVINLNVDTVTLPNGNTATREIVHHPGGVAILPIDENGDTYLVRQFRKPFERTLLEAPAGKLTSKEFHLDCGKRELLEETGFTSTKMTFFGSIIPSPGYTNEKIYLYAAQDLTFSAQNPDEDEFLNIEKYIFNDVLQMCLNNEINDAKTIAVVLRAKYVLKL